MRRFLVVLLLFPFVAFALKPVGAERRVLVLGDSLSAAYHIAPEAGWVNLLGTRLHDTGGGRVINASISGETSAGGLARLPALLAEHKPNLVLIELGANDGLRGLPLAEIRANLRSLVERSRAAGAEILLIGIELPVNYGPQYRDGLRAMYRDLATEFNVPLVPFLLSAVATHSELMQEDGLHPTAGAEPAVLETVWTVLQGMLTPPGH
ncbi:MAG: arylesterase [Tahibacter sp.]